MNYIGVEDPEVAKERVKIRVSKGGHGIPDKDIERRYYDSLNNLNNVIEMCDEVNIYDNTEVLREIIYLKNDKIIWRDKKIPNWANNILKK
ncbi:putative ATPase [Clostridium botulinum]|nr:putative ATPase [Clostridium botulinum]